MSEKISLVLPVLSADEGLYTCLKELQKQTCGDMEIIAVCGAGDSADIGADSRVRVITGTFGSLVEAALAGVAAAEGTLVGFACSAVHIDAAAFETLRAGLVGKNADAAVCRPHETSAPLFEKKKDTGKAAEADYPFVPWRDVVFSGRKAVFDLLISGDIQGTLCGKLFRRELFEGIKVSTIADASSEALLAELFRRSGRVALLQQALYSGEETTAGAFETAMAETLRQQERVLIAEAVYPEFAERVWSAYSEALETMVVEALAAGPEEGMQNKSVLTERLWPFYRDRGQGALGDLSRQKRIKYRILLQKPEVFWSVWPAIRRVKSFLIHD